MQGEKKEESRTVSSAMRGVMRKTATRMEAFALISKK
jgi:GTP cyclohydrolase I